LSEYDALIRNSELEPDELWYLLDSFWRHRTVPASNSLVRYLTYGMLVAFLNNYARSKSFQSAYNIQILETYLRLPWCPIIIYENDLREESFVAYGEGYDYDPTPEIYYGQAGVITRWVYPIATEFVRVDGFTNAITNATYWAGPSSAIINRGRSQLEFLYDPFDSVTAKVDVTTGQRYIILWAQNLEIDLEVPFDQIGWVLEYKSPNSEHYARSLRQLWKLVIHGPSLATYVSGLNAALGYPLAAADGTIIAVQPDGYQTLVSTEDNTYPGLLTWPLTKLAGDTLQRDEPIFAAVRPYEYDAVLLASSTEIPGLVLNFPFSNGTFGALGFANIVTAWSFELGRPSEWRFPISGSPADIEKFWVDVDTFAVANGVNFQTLFGLPAAVNPMKLLVAQLLKSKVVVIRVPLALIPVQNPAGFHDRALALFSPGTMLVLQQDIGSLFDIYDLGTTTSETVGYGYHIPAPTETISVPGNGTALVYFDYTPFVAAS